MIAWTDPCGGEEMDGILEFGLIVRGDLNSQLSLEEHGYNCLWQQPDESVMYIVEVWYCVNLNSFLDPFFLDVLFCFCFF